MFSRFHLFRRKPRANRAAPVTLPPPTPRTNTNPNTSINRISTLSNATTLHPLQNEIIPASLLSSFPAPPTYQPLPLSPEAMASQPDPPQPQPQHPHTLLPNTSQSSLATLADPLGRLPEAPNRLSTFEAFISHARQAEAQRIERERYMVRAWLAAEEERRRTAGRSLSGDPWRGRFGPPASDTNHFPTGLGIGMGGYGSGSGSRYAPQVQFNGGMRMPPTRMHRVVRSSVERERPRTSGGGVKAAKVWLRKVTSLERLRA